MKQLSSSSSRCKLIYIGWINNKVLLFNMGNCIQYPVINHKGKEYKKQCLYTCIRLTMLYSIVHTGHSKLPLTTTQEMTLHMNIIRWSVLKSDWLYYLQLKMEKLYIDSKDKTGSWLWLRSWTAYCQIQAYIEESKKNHWAIQVWPK